MKDFEQKRKEIKRLCRRHHVAELAVFDTSFLEDSNSCEKGFLVRFEVTASLDYSDNYCAFKKALRDLVNCEIMLIEAQAVKNPFMEKILEASKIILYGRQDKGMAV